MSRGAWTHRREPRSAFVAAAINPNLLRRGNTLIFFCIGLMSVEKQDNAIPTALLCWGRCMRQKKAYIKAETAKIKLFVA